MSGARRFSGIDDWSKDRKKAAEKEFMVREEKKKLEALRNKKTPESNRSIVEDLSSDDEDVQHILQDRDRLYVP